ncbi:MAG: hypothetical protein AAGF26_18035 [Cyanobacteria bacterium P01_G01_bin.49]
MVDFRAAKTKTKTYGFEPENFPFITLREDLNETWNNLGLTDLHDSEREGLVKLLTYSVIANCEDFNPESVLLVKAIGGVPTGIYGPAIFRDGDSIILRVGDNQTSVTQDGDRLQVGELKGKISVSASEDASGKEYPTATVSFVSPDKEIFKVRVSLDIQNDAVTVGELEAAIINEEPIIAFLGQVPGQVLKMNDLGIGEFPIKAISSTMSKYGESWKLHLADGRVVWARGNSQLLLEAGYQMKPNVPLTLIITEIEEYGDGKFKVTNALRERLPQLTGEVNPVVKTLEAQVSEVTESDDESEAEAKQGGNPDRIPF